LDKSAAQGGSKRDSKKKIYISPVINIRLTDNGISNMSVLLQVASLSLEMAKTHSFQVKYVHICLAWSMIEHLSNLKLALSMHILYGINPIRYRITLEPLISAVSNILPNFLHA